MLKEGGFAYQMLVLAIIIVIAIAGVLVNKVIGKDGMVDKVVEVETEFSKEDVLEKLNYKVTQKFIELNNTAKQNNQKISELYNQDVVIEFLKQNEMIVASQDEAGNPIGGVYEIDVGKVRDEAEVTSNLGTFKLEKRENQFFVVYYDENGEAQEIGELQIQQT